MNRYRSARWRLCLFLRPGKERSTNRIEMSLLIDSRSGGSHENGCRGNSLIAASARGSERPHEEKRRTSSVASTEILLQQTTPPNSSVGVDARNLTFSEA